MAEPIDIFISYARENRLQAQGLKNLLNARNYRVFLDVENRRPGQPWRDTLVEALKQASVVCVLWSRAAHDPKRAYVREEASIAKGLGSYFPICLDDGGVPYGFGEFHYADLMDWTGDHSDERLEGIIDQLEQFLSERRLALSTEPAIEEVERNESPRNTETEKHEPVTKIIDTRWHPLNNGMPPDWASGWGEDQFGVWVAFTVDEVTQRMRWIAPGRFTMGSPQDEPGRYDDEGPRHEVILIRGYWMFDTPCTQALWQAVMGENPSYFKSPDRPVESVSWEDCQGFLNKINSRLPGLNLILPTEAQWEYACRAGTDQATYAGPIEILGDANVPGLDPIAWYGGNSGRGFDLENGLEASQWLSERQYPDDPSGTHPVKKKRPNAWGVFDMLGNVWEWCSDVPRDYAQGSVVDPEGITPTGADRVRRGSSWGLMARYVRCACRYWFHPGPRFDGIGFRPARVQS
ncbi:MAG: SUMF1/EgtB/PvdO family nonheme iron enzyme [Methylococcales bacterium]